MSMFRTGMEEAAKSQNASFQRVEYFKLDDGEQIVVRFLCDYDETASVDVHTMVPVQKSAPEGRKNWPKTVGAVCRRTELPGGQFLFPDCYIDDHIRTPTGGVIKKSQRTYGLAVVREQVIGDGTEALGGEANKGKLLGYRDKMKDVQVTDATGKATGDVEKVRDVRIVGQAYKNFWSHLEGMAGVHGTLLDRDYYIKRKGDDTSTEYQIVHLDPQHVNVDGTVVVFDLRDPRFAERYGITIGPDTWTPDPKRPEYTKPRRHYPEELDIDRHIMRQMDDHYYGMYFDPRLPQEVRGGSATPGEAQAAQPVAKPNSEASSDQMEALRSRVTSYSQQPAGAPAEAEAPPQTPTPEPAPAAPAPAAEAPPSAPAPAPAPAPVPEPVPATGGPVVVPDFG